MIRYSLSKAVALKALKTFNAVRFIQVAVKKPEIQTKAATVSLDKKFLYDIAADYMAKEDQLKHEPSVFFKNLSDIYNRPIEEVAYHCSILKRIDLLQSVRQISINRTRIRRKIGDLASAKQKSEQNVLPQLKSYNFWSPVEEGTLTTLVLDYIVQNQPLNWNAIAAILNESSGQVRSGDVCWRKWRRSLSPLVKKGRFNIVDKKKLLSMVEVYGPCWNTISAKLRYADDRCRLMYRYIKSKGYYR